MGFHWALQKCSGRGWMPLARVYRVHDTTLMTISHAPRDPLPFFTEEWFGFSEIVKDLKISWWTGHGFQNIGLNGICLVKWPVIKIFKFVKTGITNIWLENIFREKGQQHPHIVQTMGMIIIINENTRSSETALDELIGLNWRTTYR